MKSMKDELPLKEARDKFAFDDSWVTGISLEDSSFRLDIEICEWVEGKRHYYNAELIFEGTQEVAFSLEGSVSSGALGELDFGHLEILKAKGGHEIITQIGKIFVVSSDPHFKVSKTPFETSSDGR